MKAAATIFLLATLTAAELHAAQLVPYVGCPGTTQEHDDEFPASGPPVSVPLSKKIADRVAVYASLEGSVLAPRGWQCSSMRGTGTGTLFIAPPAGTAAALKGASVLLSYSPGDSYPASLTIAGYVGRYFPKLSPGIVEAESQSRGITKEDVLGPRYPKDVLRYKSDRVLEFLTPPQQRGLGTRLRDEYGPSPLPTYGVLAIDMPAAELNAAAILAIRLPPELTFLRRPMLGYFEHTFPHK